VTSMKSFAISKRMVFEAWKRVKANRGSAGIDEQSVAEFEKNLSNNLYALWNRLSSGSYFPPPVKQVPIPKRTGGIRMLGVPTVSANYPGSQRVFGMGRSSTSIPPVERPTFPGP
jgi:RNA-directed DNA polymerase